ncbi:MAG: hypothetical protein ACR2GH_03565, partial [Pseudonocardia sp.]
MTRIVLPIAATCADVGAQVLVGTRRGDDAGDLLRIFGPACTIIDLDDSRYFAVDDLTAYAQATLQLRGDERPSNPYQPDAVAAPVARRIAELADRNFLIAGLVARTHGLYDEHPVGPDAVAFTASVESTLDTFLDRLAPVGSAPARVLLTALAFAEVPGFTLELWQLATRALGGAEVTVAQLRQFASGSAANFLVESTGRTATSAFRLFHQALGDALGTARGRLMTAVLDEAALTRAFVEHGARIGWENAPPYLFRSLPGHAVRANMVDELLAETDYVLHADLRRLIPAAAHARTLPGRDTAHLLRMTPRAIPAAPPDRLAMLSVTETIDSASTTFRDSLYNAPYRGIWAAVPRRAERTVLEGHTSWVRGVCAVRVGQRELLASAGVDGMVRVWDPESGVVVQVLHGHTSWVNGVCAVRVGQRELLASAGDDGMVRVWDPESGVVEQVVEGHTSGVNGVCAVRVGRRELLASAGDDGTVRVWDPGSGVVVQVVEGHTSGVNGVCAV